MIARANVACCGGRVSWHLNEGQFEEADKLLTHFENLIRIAEEHGVGKPVRLALLQNDLRLATAFITSAESFLREHRASRRRRP